MICIPNLNKLIKSFRFLFKKHKAIWIPKACHILRKKKILKES